MNMHRIITFLFLLIWSVSITRSYAQQTGNNQPAQTLRGTVIDKASGHPMPDVTIMLRDMPGTGTTTDEKGQFVLSGIPVGRHNVEATFLGYEPGIFREVLVTSAKEVNLDISLKENVRELSEVVIRPQINKEQPLNKMAVTGARMLSVEEASRYAGGLDDPARLVSSFPIFPVTAYLSMEMLPICCNGEWKMWKYPTRTILPTFRYWAVVSFPHSAARSWEIPISSPVHFLPNTGMLFPEFST